MVRKMRIILYAAFDLSEMNNGPAVMPVNYFMSDAGMTSHDTRRGPARYNSVKKGEINEAYATSCERERKSGQANINRTTKKISHTEEHEDEVSDVMLLLLFYRRLPHTGFYYK